MADSMTQALFGDEAAKRYESKSQATPAANAFDRLVQAGATSSMVDIDGVKQGQAQQTADTMNMRDAQKKNDFDEEVRRMQALEEKRAKVNQVVDDALSRSAERLNDFGITGI